MDGGKPIWYPNTFESSLSHLMTIDRRCFSRYNNHRCNIILLDAVQYIRKNIRNAAIHLYVDCCNDCIAFTKEFDAQTKNSNNKLCRVCTSFKNHDARHSFSIDYLSHHQSGRQNVGVNCLQCPGHKIPGTVSDAPWVSTESSWDGNEAGIFSDPFLSSNHLYGSSIQFLVGSWQRRRNTWLEENSRCAKFASSATTLPETWHSSSSRILSA